MSLENTQGSFTLPFLRGRIRQTNIPPHNSARTEEFVTSKMSLDNTLKISSLTGSSPEVVERAQKRLLVRSFFEEQSERSHINSYEREKLRDLLIQARSLFMSGRIGKTVLREIRDEVVEKRKLLDFLNGQVPLYNPDKTEIPKGVQIVEIETPELGKLQIRVSSLKGVQKDETQKKDKVPTLFSTGWSADYKSSWAAQMSWAMAGVDTIGVSMPEHYTSTVPQDWPEKLKKSGDYSLHAKVMVEVCKKLGLKEVDLAAYSAGASVFLAMAHDLSLNPDPDLAVRNLDVFNPVGFAEMSPLELGLNFVKAGDTSKTPDVGRRAMVVQRSRLSDWTAPGMLTFAADVLTKRIFTSKYLKDIKTSGRANVYYSDIDPVSVGTSIEAEISGARASDPDSQIGAVKIRKGHHGMMVQAAAGLAETFSKGGEIKTGTDITQIPATQADLIRQSVQNNYNIVI